MAQCNEGRPICERCLRAGRECVYPSQFQFIDTNTQFATPETPERPALQKTGVDKFKARLSLIYEEGGADGMTYKFQLLRYRSPTPPSSSNDSSPLIPKGPSLSRGEKLASALAASFQTPLDGYRLHYLGRYMTEIPCRLGHNPALDLAVECLLQSHAQLLETNLLCQTDPQPSPEYMKAIQTLQNVIADPVLGTSAETVCATMLMAYYEVRPSNFVRFFRLMLIPFYDLAQMIILERRSRQYVAHAGGASKLISIRGPERVRTNFEYSLFRTQHGRIVSITMSLYSCRIGAYIHLFS